MSQTAQVAPAENRVHERVAATLSGKMFIPAEEATIDCSIVNLSAGGAGVACDEPPPLNAFVVLYIDGFGRFEGVATRYVNGELGLKFVCKDAKRSRLVEDLTAYVQDGTTAKTRLRRHERVPSRSVTHFTRPNGDKAPCDVVDISLQGVSLRTDIRPPVGELINLGRTFGRVVRYHDDGIAIQFMDVTDGPVYGR